ncbi:hypothetical protein GBAR_LOCUS30124 [Geodia barretti]|uniref:Uncharacterized protein n=1 Tax=Geodia barretti TaxID=519541 RepID=A0AA35TY52_GEOBA|nr:hypothetical protein GBAR_LOCUS30124 [Geodia barretti]
MGALGKTPRLVHSWGGKLMGATMWCWILWRFKHDWRDVLGHHDSLEPPPLKRQS